MLDTYDPSVRDMAMGCECNEEFDAAIELVWNDDDNILMRGREHGEVFGQQLEAHESWVDAHVARAKLCSRLLTSLCQSEVFGRLEFFSEVVEGANVLAQVLGGVIFGAQVVDLITEFCRD